MLGGRAAEEIKFGNKEITSGCGDDLSKATRIAMQSVLGGLLSGQSLAVFDYKDLSQKRKYEIDMRIQSEMTQSLVRSKALLTRYKKLLDAMSRRLMEKDTLSDLEVNSLIAAHKQ